MPGSTRRFKAGHIRSDILEDLVVSSEICELRVWDPKAPNNLIPNNRTTLASNDDRVVETRSVAGDWDDAIELDEVSDSDLEAEMTKTLLEEPAEVAEEELSDKTEIETDDDEGKEDQQSI